MMLNRIGYTEEVPEKSRPIALNSKGGGFTVCLLVSAFSASICSSLQYGYNISVLTGPSVFIQPFYNQSYYTRHDEYLTENSLRWLWAITIAVYSVGGSCGSIIAIYMSEAFGRKRTLLLNSFVTSAAALLMFSSKYINSFEMIIIGRCIIGIAAGIVQVTVPLYLSEISPVLNRGTITAFHQFGSAVGIAIGQFVGLYPFYSEETWPVVLVMPAVLTWIGFTVMIFCPESPRWLLMSKITKKDDSQVLSSVQIGKLEARNALVRLRNTSDVDGEITEMLKERAALERSHSGRVGILELITLKNPLWKWPLIISIVITGGQQLGGIKSIMYYTTEVFNIAELSEDTVRLATLGTGIVLVVTSSLPMLNVDKRGRRFFLLWSYAIMAVSTVFLTISFEAPGNAWSYLSIVFVYIFVIAFGPGAGTMTFVVLPELWTQGPRPAAMAFSCQFNWWSNFAVGLAFPFMLNAMEGYAFLIFTCILVSIILFIYFIVPETKNKTFTEIVSRFRRASDNVYSIESNGNKQSISTTI